MPTLPNMTLITPTLGGDSGTWDDKINACFALIDAHDHTSGKGTLVPVSGLDIDADFAMGGNAVTGLGSIAFNAVTALAAGSKRLFVSSSDNELYWRTNGGTNVKLTAGTSINTTLVGGIVGDYTSVGAEVAFSDADQVYTFKDQSSPTKKWARMASGPVRIYENDTTESVYVEHAVAAALASSYTVTWPAALPASAAFMQISAAGVVSFSNSMSITEQIPASQARTVGSTNTNNNGNAWSFGNAATTANAVYYPLRIREGETITGISVKVSKSSDAANTITMELGESDGISTFSAVAAFTASNSANAPGTVTLTGSGTQVATVGKQYVIRVYQSNSTPSAVDSVGVATFTHT